MDVEHADDELSQLETDSTASSRAPAIVKGFRRRMQAIRAAQDERDLYAVKGNRFEKLKGDRKGQHSLVVTGNWRLIVEIVGDPQGAKKIRIIDIVDYH